MDSPYVINYLITLLLAYLYWKSPNSRYVKFAFLLQFIFIAFRAPVVGADTWDYIRYLDGERNFYNTYDSRELEIGFQIYRQLLMSLHGNRFIYMLINTLLTCYPVYLLIKKYQGKTSVPKRLAYALCDISADFSFNENFYSKEEAIAIEDMGIQLMEKVCEFYQK